MGFKDWLNKLLKRFDEQVEGYGYPVDGARRPAPAPRPAVERERLRSTDGARGPAVRRTPTPPPSAPRHRLDPSRRRRDDETDTGFEPDLTIGATLESATPRWVDESGHHDHRHHGHSAAAEHRVEDTPSTSHHTTHHGSHDSGSSWGGGSHHGSHDSGGWGGGGHDSGGGYDGGGSSCGGGGSD